MRSAVPLRARKNGLPITVKSALIVLCILLLIWSSLQFNLFSALGSAFSRGLSGEAAVAMLKAETASDGLRAPSYRTLLSFGSPLLASVKPAAGGEKTPSGGSFFPGRSDPPLADPGLAPMNPMLDIELPPEETPDPPNGIDSQWDDRVWPMPDGSEPEALPLHEVTLLPVSADGGYLTDGTVAVNNETKYTYDIPAMLARKLSFKPVESGPQILIIHTHASESFLPDERDFYIPTDIERTEDTRYNIVRVGDEITERLEELGLTVLHDRNINDYPTYSGSYNRTLKAIEDYIKEYPSIQIVLDIHRDSISAKDGTIYKAVCDSVYGKTAQMMFVVGSNGTGLPHDGWRDNLTFAAQIQNRVLEACPTAMRPIHLRKERFNQHATPGSLILEVGTAANSLTEALRAANLFCDAAGPYLAEMLLS